MPPTDELEERFRNEVRKLMVDWRRESIAIDTRGIASGENGCMPMKVAGWINAKGSRTKFDEAIEKLGPKGTVESIFLRPEFQDIADIYPTAAAKALDRLLGHRED